MSVENITGPAEELRHQWNNPSDVLSLLLLIGGDIVQKAIAQLVGVNIRLGAGNSAPRLSIVPVAFSFGWVAYGFSNLLSTIGDKKLMPVLDCPSLIINCSNGFVRDNQSWILGRLLRDHETRHKVDPRDPQQNGRAESIRIDVFELGRAAECNLDPIWWSGWFTIAAQIGIAVSPWYLYGNWGTMLVVLAGNLLVAITCAMPQWKDEKWAGRTLSSDKVTCLTRGNGFLHIMVLLGRKGSWDIESLATARSVPRPGTQYVSLVLAALWTSLLVSVAGLKNHAWFLVGVGGLGMVQNILAAGVSRNPGTFNLHLTRSSRAPIIIGRRDGSADDGDAIVKLDETLQELSEVCRWSNQNLQTAPQILPAVDPGAVQQIDMPRWLSTMSTADGVPQWLTPIPSSQGPGHEPIIYASGVHGALIELEKWVPSAGISMLQLFFPVGLKYDDDSIKENRHKKFWNRAYHTRSVRLEADQKRRAGGLYQ